jgi:hypothetical protein
MRVGQWSMLFVLMLLSGCAKVVVVKVDNVTPANGVIYALPNTVVRIQLKIDKTEYMKARYPHIFAPIFAPDEKTVCEDDDCTKEKAKTYSLQQNATFATYGEPDPDNVFLVKFAGRGAIDQAISMTWNEVGLATAASSTVTNRTGEVVLSTLKMAASLGTKAALGAADTAKPNAPIQCPKDPNPADKDVIPILRSASLGADSLLVGNYCAMKAADRTAVAGRLDLLSEAVTDYSNRVARLIDGRTRILAGSSPSADSTNLLTKIETELDQQLRTLYLGTKKVTTSDVVLDVRSLKPGEPLPVLRIDAAKGICVKADIPPDAKLISIPILSGQECDAGSAVNLALDYYPQKERQLFTKIKDVAEGDRSFRYRIPAQVKALLFDEKKPYGAGIFSVAQLGTIVSLPANRHSKMLSYDLGYIEATGGLKTFKLGTTGALDTATVDALNSVGGTLVDARNTARKNADEVTALTKEDQLLKLRDDICTIQKKYGVTCTVTPQQ